MSIEQINTTHTKLKEELQGFISWLKSINAIECPQTLEAEGGNVTITEVKIDNSKLIGRLSELKAQPQPHPNDIQTLINECEILLTIHEAQTIAQECKRRLKSIQEEIDPEALSPDQRLKISRTTESFKRISDNIIKELRNLLQTIKNN